MTYCVAWVAGDGAFLIADTLRTSSVPWSDGLTSFGEPEWKQGEDYVGETALKIHSVREGVAFALAGDNTLGSQIAHFIIEHFADFGSLQELCQCVTKSLGPFNDDRKVGILFATSTHGSPPVVGRWDSLTGTLATDSWIFQIGSLDEFHKHRTATLIERMCLQPVHMRSLLVAAIAAIQSYGRHDDLLAQNVGGIVCGLSVKDGRTYWQEDTVSVLYDDEASDGVISSHFREGQLVINSDFHGDTGRVLTTLPYNEDNLELAKEWMVRWLPDLRAYIPERIKQCRTWIFLHLKRRTATALVFLSENATIEHFFDTKMLGNRLAIRPTNAFGAILHRAATDGANINVHVIEVA